MKKGMEYAYDSNQSRGRIPLVVPEASTTLPSIPGCAVTQKNAPLILTEGKRAAQRHAVTIIQEQAHDCLDLTNAQFFSARLNAFNPYSINSKEQ